MTKEEQEFYSLYNFTLPPAEKQAIVGDVGFDWGNMISNAQKTCLSNYFYKEIKFRETFIPEDKFNIFKQGYICAFLKNLKRIQEILQICKSLNENNIRFVVIQGWALIFSDYPDIGLRNSGDVDIYIPKEDIKRCIGVFFNLGYSCLNTKEVSRLTHIDFSKRGMQRFEITEDPLKLIAPIKNEKCFLKESITKEIEGVRAKIPSAEYLLLGLIVHLQRENLAYPLRVYDIAYILHKKKNELDWHRFLDITFEERLQVPVYYSLLIAKRFFSPPLPTFVFKRLNPNEFKKKIFLKLCADNNDWLNGSSTLKKKQSFSRGIYLYAWLTRNDLWHKIKFLFLKFLYPFDEIWSFPTATKVTRPLFRGFRKSRP